MTEEDDQRHGIDQRERQPRTKASVPQISGGLLAASLAYEHSRR